MSGDPFTDPEDTASHPAFATTHWSVVAQARDQDSPLAAAALDALCRQYWYPLYAYVRRRGHGPEDAQDLTQEFFRRFLRRGSFGSADPDRGRFRCFLLKSLQHFLVDDWKRLRRAKRGGGVPVLGLDPEAAERRWGSEAREPMAPDLAYDRHWASTLLEQVLERLRGEYEQAGKSRLFEALGKHLWGLDDANPYAGIATDMDMTEGALRVAVHRLRARYRALLRHEVAQTVGERAEIDEELHYLIRVIAETA